MIALSQEKKSNEKISFRIYRNQIVANHYKNNNIKNSNRSQLIAKDAQKKERMLDMNKTVEKTLKNFTNQFPISKTLRFELKPIGETLEYIKVNNILNEDRIREENYQELKKVLDREYNDMLTRILKNFETDWINLADALTLNSDVVNRREIINEEKEKVAGKLNEHIKKNTKNMFTEKFLKAVLEYEDITDRERQLIEHFKGFSTYLTTYFQNRENIFLETGKGVSAINRIVNENFPRFLDGVKNYKKIINNEKVITEIRDNIRKNEEFGVDDLDEFFKVENFNNLIDEDGIERYNALIGGFTKESGKKIQGLNEIINEYNQKSVSKIKRFTALYKQPLSPKNTISWVPDIIKDDEELFDTINGYLETIPEKFTESIESLYNNCIEKNNFAIKIQLLNNISNAIFKDWSYLNQKIEEKLVRENQQEKGEKSLSKKEKEKIKKSLEESASNKISMYEIKNSISEDEYDSVTLWLKSEAIAKAETAQKEKEKYVTNISRGAKIKGNDRNEESVKQLLESFNELLKFISHHELKLGDDNQTSFQESLEILSPVNLVYNKARNYITKKEDVEDKIKLNFSTPMLGSGWSKSKERENLTIILRRKINGKYMYYLGIMKKKEKIDFEEMISEDAETYEKMEYFLFPDAAKMIPKCSITTKEVKNAFEKNGKNEIILSGGNFTQPLKISRELYELYNPSYCDKEGEVYEDKTFTTKFIRNKWINPELEGIGSEEKKLKENDKYKLDVYKEALAKWIDFSKDFLSKYKGTSIFDFSHLKKSEEYRALDEFYNDINKAAYKIEFVNLSKNKIDRLVEEGKLYLFQIYNKDFSEHSRGKENLHTIYFKEIFSEENLENPIHKLSGGAEIFYRKKSEKNSFSHKKGEYLVNKTYFSQEKDGKKIYKNLPEELYMDICKILQECKKTDKKYDKDLEICVKKWNKSHKGDIEIKTEQIEINRAKYEIKKDKRFFENKYFLHVPIEMNFVAENGKNKLNSRIIEHLIKNKDGENAKEIKYLGVDRGERNLISLCLVNSKGEIEHQENINLVETNRNGKGIINVDYNEKLSSKAKTREEERKNWKSISNIRNLKEGYLSGVVHKVAKMAIEENAIIIMESLNTGFKRSRQKIEKSIYQKFEKMLMNKLSFLVEKNIQMGPGSIREPIQLTREFKEEKDLKGHNGIIFYISPFWTSQIDPATGFVRNFKEKKNGRKIKAITEDSLLSLRYISPEEGFKFKIDFSKMERIFELKNNIWEIYTIGEKFIFNSDRKSIDIVNVTEKLEAVFNSENIEYKESQELREIVLENKKLLRTVDCWFKERTKLRNKNENQDFILSPVKNSAGKFFNSKDDFEGLPKDSDLNGAYNIALKGKFKIEKTAEKYKDGKINLYKMNDSEWLDDYQKRLYFKH